MGNQTWDEWIAEHGRQVVDYVMVCLEDAKELWDRAVKAEKAQDKAQARIAELEAAQAKDRESYANTKLHNILLDELIAIRTPCGEQPKPLEITDETVEEMAKALRAHETKTPWVQASLSIQVYWRGLARAALEAVKDQLVAACSGCAEKAERITAIEKNRDHWKHHAKRRLDLMEKERIRANRLESDCDAKVERITELGFDALAMETEMSQARRRIEALEAVLRDMVGYLEACHPHSHRRKAALPILRQYMNNHHITLTDPEGDAPATREPAHVEAAQWPNCHACRQGCETVVDAELAGKIEDIISEHLFGHSEVPDVAKEILSLIGPRMTPLAPGTALNVIFDGPPSHESGRFVEVETDEGKSVCAGEWIERDDGLWALRLGPYMTPEIQERLDYLKREHAKFCEIFNDYAEEEVTEYFQTRLAHGDAAIAVLREYRKWLESTGGVHSKFTDMLRGKGILDLITGELDGSCSNWQDICPGTCDTCGDTLICPRV